MRCRLPSLTQWGLDTMGLGIFFCNFDAAPCCADRHDTMSLRSRCCLTLHRAVLCFGFGGLHCAGDVRLAA